MKCSSVTLDTISGNKYTCSATCDLTATGTTELKLTSMTLTSSNPPPFVTLKSHENQGCVYENVAQMKYFKMF